MERNLPNFRYSIRRVVDPRDVSALRSLLAAYADTLPPGSCREEATEQSLQVYCDEPNAAWIAHSEMRGIGCVAMRSLDSDTIRLERLFVLEAYRGQKVGLSLCRRAIRHAIRRRFTRVVLDTLPSMSEARVLYRSLGFVEASSPDWDGCDGRIPMVLALD